MKIKCGRSLRSMRLGLRQRTSHYVRSASKKLGLVTLLFLFLMIAEMVQGVTFDPISAVNNKAMHFKVHPDNGTYPNYLNYETGDILDTTNPDYDERRWTFYWGADMVLRFNKGYSFCPSYVIVPGENLWPRSVRVILYMAALFYLFLGVAIIADIFMSGIETVTSEREKIVMKKDADGEKPVVIMYTAWNETVANLTLMALGSSAPEILLSILETINDLDKVPGELGPGTIIGSAAFNLLVITSVCMCSLDDVKKINDLGVFIITSASSVFAYVWTSTT
eukprot:TRINITY_DN18068_c0_g2_i1.p1 TRINITY_DN18068_c0_g2~~TRINITY_DN18068_c0_g2_i1.p1  ORF type:complete len:280 (+),score=74.41 TRINITY_DN18068_c0_g2_i1:116-955(+)